MTKTPFISKAVLDLFFVICMVTLMTGGAHVIPKSLEVYFSVHPKYHRLMLSSVTLGFLAVGGYLHFRGLLETRSNLFAYFMKLKFRASTYVWFLFLLLSTVFVSSSIFRHRVFNSSFDFAIFAQAVWNTWKGNLLYSSIKGGICLLGDHFSPILIPLAPLYGIWADPQVLLVLQGIVGASSIFPLFLIAQKILKDNALALLFTSSFAFYLPLRNAVRFDFHPELLGDPLICWAFYFVLIKRLRAASMCLAVTLITKETAFAPIAMFGFFCFQFFKFRRFGMIWFFVSIIYFIIIVKFLIPHFYGQEYFYLRGNYLAWKELGFAAFQKHILQPSTFTYLKKIFLPVGFLSFLSPSTFMLTWPILFQNLTTRNLMARSIYFQYTTFLTPFIFISAICGFRNALNWMTKHNLRFIKRPKLLLSYWLLGTTLLSSGVSEYYVIAQFKAQDSSHLAYLRSYFETVPASVSVRTHEFFAPHLAKRHELYIYENTHPKEGGSEKAQNADMVIIDRMLLGNDYERHLTDLRNRNYTLQHEHEGLFVFEHRKI